MRKLCLTFILSMALSCIQRSNDYDNDKQPAVQSQNQNKPEIARGQAYYDKKQQQSHVDLTISREALVPYAGAYDLNNLDYLLEFKTQNGNATVKSSGKLVFEPNAAESNPITIRLTVGLTGVLVLTISKLNLVGQSPQFTVTLEQTTPIIIDIKSAPNNNGQQNNQPSQQGNQDQSNNQNQTNQSGQQNNSQSGNVSGDMAFIADAGVRAEAQKAYLALGKVQLNSKEYAKKVIRYFCSGCHQGPSGSGDIEITDDDPGIIKLSLNGERLEIFVPIKWDKTSNMPKGVKGQVLKELDGKSDLDYRNSVLSAFKN